MRNETVIQEAIKSVKSQIEIIKGYKKSTLEKKQDDTKYQLVIQELQLVINSTLNPLLLKEQKQLQSIDQNIDTILDLCYKSLQWESGEISGWNQEWLESQLQKKIKSIELKTI